MTLYIKGTEIQIAGTLEAMQGTALISGLNDDGTLSYVGETQVHEDSTETVFEGAYPVWIAAGREYEEFHGVEVEDRRADGTIIAYKALSDDDAAEDELVDLLNLAIAKAGAVLEKKNLDSRILQQAAATRMHLSNLETTLNRIIRESRGQGV